MCFYVVKEFDVGNDDVQPNRVLRSTSLKQKDMGFDGTFMVKLFFLSKYQISVI